MNFPWTHDRDHVRLLQNAHADWIEAQYRGMAQMPGNPMGVIIRTIGPTRTFIARGERLENRAIFTGEETDEEIAEVLEHFVDHQANCVIEVNPANFYVDPPMTWEKRLITRLLELGCAIHDFRCVWYATAAPSTSASFHCERFGPEEIEPYANLARQVDPKETWSADKIAAASQPGWRHYVLFDSENQPRGNGSLFVTQNQIAYLAWWYTQPSHRGQGMQQAGIVHRLNDAFDLGCRCVFTVTDFNFTSPANLQRCGFSLAYNYLLVRRDPTALTL